MKKYLVFIGIFAILVSIYFAFTLSMRNSRDKGADLPSVNSTGTVYKYDPSLGSICGRITDGSSGIEAQLSIYSPEGNVAATATSNKAGYYTVNNLPIGNYRIVDTRSGKELTVNVTSKMCVLGNLTVPTK